MTDQGRRFYDQFQQCQIRLPDTRGLSLADTGRMLCGRPDMKRTPGVHPIRQYALLVAGLITVLFAIYGYHVHGAAGQVSFAAYRDLALLLGAVLLILFGTLVFLVLRPLQSIALHVERLGGKAGESVTRMGRDGPLIAEAEQIRASLDECHGELALMHSDLEQTSRELRALADHDALTGARNRKAFDEYLRDLPATLSGRRITVSFALFDISHFKAINDTYGHQTGNEILKQVARRMTTVLRQGEHLFRVGGDEFALLMPGTDTDGAQVLAERCLQELEAEDFTVLGVREPVRVCVGIAGASFDDPESMNTLQWRADIAMYNAKRPGTANIAVFHDTMARGHEGIFSNRVNSAVYEAITLGTGLTMFYQPVVELETGEIRYYEALVRIRSGDDWISPAVIFPLVEARRLEVDLDLAVMKRVLEDLRTGKVQRGSGVSINLSGPAVIDRNLPEWLAGFRPFLADYRIVLEVTETALITQIANAGENLSRLRQQGFEIALDDFGSGYSSFHYLASMPVDTVKFDISLIRGLGDEKQRLIVEHLVAMIDGIGHRLVAEGIEDEDILESVRQAGFKLGQGYYFGRPVQSAWRADFEIDNVLCSTDRSGLYSNG